jgi:hypothetical protein
VKAAAENTHVRRQAEKKREQQNRRVPRLCELQHPNGAAQPNVVCVKGNKTEQMQSRYSDMLPGTGRCRVADRQAGEETRHSRTGKHNKW